MRLSQMARIVPMLANRHLIVSEQGADSLLNQELSRVVHFAGMPPPVVQAAAGTGRAPGPPASTSFGSKLDAPEISPTDVLSYVGEANAATRDALAEQGRRWVRSSYRCDTMASTQLGVTRMVEMVFPGWYAASFFGFPSASSDHAQPCGANIA
jgi:hypothetical protein